MSIGDGDAEVNVLNLCRLCLQKDTHLTPIFRSCDSSDELALKIVSWLPVKISRNDKIKSKICGECLFKVETFYEFWLRISEAQKQFENWLNSNDQNLEIESQFQASTILTSEDIEEEKEKLSSINSDIRCQITTDNKNVEEEEDLFDILTHLDNICNSDDELEPTTFVNVSLDADEPGPSGFNSNSTSSSSFLP